jgi:hypothetical protein
MPRRCNGTWIEPGDVVFLTRAHHHLCASVVSEKAQSLEQSCQSKSEGASECKLCRLHFGGSLMKRLTQEPAGSECFCACTGIEQF